MALSAQGVRPLADRAHLARRFRADGVWFDIAALLVRAVRQKQGRAPEPTTAILDSQSVVSGPQAGVRGVDGNKKVRGIKRHVLTCSLGEAGHGSARAARGMPAEGLCWPCW